MLHQFIRTLRIVGLRPSYSNGFNPHPKISVALPLSLGFASNCEFLELETDAIMDPAIAIKNINDILPDGLEVIEFTEKSPEIKKTLASLVTEVRYDIITAIPDTLLNKADICSEEIEYKNSFDRRDKIKTIREEIIRDSISSFLGQERIITTKLNRKKNVMQEFDLKPYIICFEMSSIWSKQVMFDCNLSTKDSRSINPLTVTEAFFTYSNSEIPASSEIRVLRKNISF